MCVSEVVCTKTSLAFNSLPEFLAQSPSESAILSVFPLLGSLQEGDTQLYMMYAFSPHLTEREDGA